jgi:hypothetical protein
MVRVDSDKEPESSRRLAPDGQYIPRTYFLSSAGEIDSNIHAPRERFRFFYDTQDPKDLLASMANAARKPR